ncbi:MULTISPECIES: phage head closure protein [Rhodomicrobium]|uniref:phage head closure protein n=1 Tax=Rhodomicrobium TaxID=1068 RepID=UPI000B4B2A0B|nr:MULTISPECIES: phage head closure protein [Rhodomicrobium]
MRGAGSLDRRITILRATISSNGFNERVENWTPLATVWARRTEKAAGEAYRADEVAAERTTLFRIRWSTPLQSVSARDRIAAEGRDFNIVGVMETGRRRWLDIEAVARADVAATEDGA